MDLGKIHIKQQQKRSILISFKNPCLNGIQENTPAGIMIQDKENVGSFQLGIDQDNWVTEFKDNYQTLLFGKNKIKYAEKPSSNPKLIIVKDNGLFIRHLSEGNRVQSRIHQKTKDSIIID